MMPTARRQTTRISVAKARRKTTTDAESTTDHASGNDGADNPAGRDRDGGREMGFDTDGDNVADYDSINDVPGNLQDKAQAGPPSRHDRGSRRQEWRRSRRTGRRQRRQQRRQRLRLRRSRAVAGQAMSADPAMSVRGTIRAACAWAAIALGAAPVIGDGPAMGECARDLLRTRLATAVAGDDVLAALAVEGELLALCSRRQELVAEVLENEERLAGLQFSEPLIDETVIAEVFEAPEPPPDLPEPPPDYGWFSILGTSGDLRAGITDGTDARGG